MDILTLKKAVRQASEYSPADPASGEWEPTKVTEALDILAGSRIVEHGSNENGEYWRWENGLQICRGSGVLSPITAEWGAIYMNSVADQTNAVFPAVFSALPSVTVDASGSYIFVGFTYQLTANGFVPRGVRGVSTVGTSPYSYIAIGRWK